MTKNNSKRAFDIFGNTPYIIVWAGRISTYFIIQLGLVKVAKNKLACIINWILNHYQNVLDCLQNRLWAYYNRVCNSPHFLIFLFNQYLICSCLMSGAMENIWFSKKGPLRGGQHLTKWKHVYFYIIHFGQSKLVPFRVFNFVNLFNFIELIPFSLY